LIKKIILINIFVAIGIIIFFECVIRFFDLVNLQGYDKNFFIKEKNVTLNRPNTNFIVAGKKAKIDDNGFRIPLKNLNNNFYNKSIFILGDSVSFGFGVAEEESFVGLLRNEIDYNIFNTSVIGHNLESYIYMLNKYKKNSTYEFKEVIIFLCLNDISISQGVIKKKQLNQIDNSKESYFIKFFKNDFFLRVNVFMREKSALFVFLKSFTTNSVKRHFDYMFKQYDDNNFIMNYSNQINKIKSISSNENININFVLLPYSYQVKKKCEKKVLKPQRIIKKIFTDLDLELHDLTSDFCQNPESKSLFLTYDPVHLSKIGHQVVNRLIIENKIIN
jgi:hypothetical protein